MSWDDDTPESAPRNALLESQIQQNERELTAKRENLSKQRIAIIKSQGRPDFTGSRANAPIQGKAPITRM